MQVIHTNQNFQQDSNIQSKEFSKTKIFRQKAYTKAKALKEGKKKRLFIKNKNRGIRLGIQVYKGVIPDVGLITHPQTSHNQSIKLVHHNPPPLKSLTSSLGPTLWGNVSELTRDYGANSDTICNDPRKSASHICVIPQKD